jgi:hypothetical protein
MTARTELLQLKERLSKQIAVLESEMATVDRAIQLLEREHQSGSGGASGSQDKRFRNVGLADACRQIVGSDWISPSEVRNYMMQGGFKNTNKARLLGGVFATLKRLGETELEGKRVDGKLKYRKRQAAALSSAEAA